MRFCQGSSARCHYCAGVAEGRPQCASMGHAASRQAHSRAVCRAFRRRFGRSNSGKPIGGRSGKPPRGMPGSARIPQGAGGGVGAVEADGRLVFRDVMFAGFRPHSARRRRGVWGPRSGTIGKQASNSIYCSIGANGKQASSGSGSGMNRTPSSSSRSGPSGKHVGRSSSSSSNTSSR